jgi:hypothetical protein
MTAVLLPIQHPPITGFVHHAYPLSIILNNPASLPWLYSNYIQLHYDPTYKDSALAFNFFHYHYPHNGPTVCPFLHHIWFSKRMIVEYGRLDTFLKDSIDRGFHVYLFCDEYYIPNRFSHAHGTHQAHDILISGYDEKSREYALQGYDENGTYRLSKATFEQMEMAFRPSEHMSKGYHDNVQLFGMNDPDWHFRLEPVIELLKDYVLSRDTSLRYGLRRDRRPDLFGLRVYELFRAYADDVHACRQGLDIRAFHLLWEHKKLMLARIRWLMDNGWLPHDPRLIADYGQVERLAFGVRGHAVKTAASQDTAYMRTASSELRSMEELEEAVLTQLIEALEDLNGLRPSAAATSPPTASPGSEWENALDFQF